MRLAILIPLAALALLAFPTARADEGDEKPDAAAGLWDAHAKQFDLDGDGRITWEEYQKVMSGFTTLDANGDGVITKDDVDALGEKLAKGLATGHTMTFTSGPQFHGAWAHPGMQGHGAGGLMQLLPLLLGGHGGGMHGMQGMPGMQGMHGGMPFHPGMGGTHGFPGMGGRHGFPGMGPAGRCVPGMQGHPGMPGMNPYYWMGHGGGGYPSHQGWQGTQILPWLLGQAQGAVPPAPSPAPHGNPAAGFQPPMAGGIAGMIPGPMKELLAFGVVAHSADTNDDDVVSKDEWAAALKSLTKDDGTLDLDRITKGIGMQGIGMQGIGMQGMPFPGGDTALFTTLLDTNGDGKVDASDLEGAFAKADKNGDGKVTRDEIMPAGMAGMGFPFGGPGR